MKDTSYRMTLAEELFRRYGDSRLGLASRLRFLRKKYCWVLIVGGAKALKRAIDILASLSGLLLLSPVYFVGNALFLFRVMKERLRKSN